MSHTRKLAYLALILAAFLWGIAPPIIKYTLNFISPLSFLFYRFLIASIIVAVPLIIKINKIKPTKKDWLWYIFLGFLCTPLNLILLFQGIQKTTAIDASIISIVAPIFVVIGGALFLKENVTKKEKLGLLIAVLGTIFTILQPIFERKNGFNLEGNLLVFLGTLVWVIFTLLAKKHRSLDPFLLSSFSFVVGLITLAPLVLFKISPTITLHFELCTLNLNSLWGVLYMSIFCSIIAYFVYFYGLSKIEASEAGIFTYLQPFFAIPLAIIFLGERLTLPFILGAIFIMVGVFISESRR